MSQPARRPAPAAGAFGARTARACDGCLRRRARWYCAADDAFLCQPCDASVHSANPLARRHERVRLKSSSSFKPQEARGENPLDGLVARQHASHAEDQGSDGHPRVFPPSCCKQDEAQDDDAGEAPSWHHGFTRKARTPRGKKGGDVHGAFLRAADTVVPDLELALLEDFPLDVVEEEEQLLYRVPIMDPLLAELCSPPTPELQRGHEHEQRAQADHLAGGLVPVPPDMGIPEFDMDVEALLGRELDEDAFSMEELGLAEAHECDFLPAVKTEEEILDDKKAVCRQVKVDVDLDTMDFDFRCYGEQQPSEDGERKRRRIMLDLDYEGVARAWDEQASPWVGGTRPQLLDLDGWLPESSWGEVPRAAGGGHAAAGDGGREARVSRYREKRRTRLFSKKIRYEVRKLNAEKRPRMKGRFVKRSSLLSQPQCVF